MILSVVYFDRGHCSLCTGCSSSLCADVEVADVERSTRVATRVLRLPLPLVTPTGRDKQTHVGETRAVRQSLILLLLHSAPMIIKLHSTSCLINTLSDFRHALLQ